MADLSLGRASLNSSAAEGENAEEKKLNSLVLENLSGSSFHWELFVLIKGDAMNVSLLSSHIEKMPLIALEMEFWCE